MAEGLRTTCRGCLHGSKGRFHSLEQKFVRELFISCTGVALEELGAVNQICSTCFEKCENWDEFRRLCYKNDQELRDHPESYWQEESEIEEQAMEQEGGEGSNVCWIDTTEGGNDEIAEEESQNPQLEDNGSSIESNSYEEDSYNPDEVDEEDNEESSTKSETITDVVAKKNRSEEIYTCNECNRSYKYRASFNKHNLAVHQIRETCTEVDAKSIKAEVSQTNAIASTRKRTYSKREPFLYCEECGATFNRLLALKKHQFAHQMGITTRIRNVSKLLDLATDPEQKLLVKCWTPKTRMKFKLSKEFRQPHFNRNGDLVEKKLEPYDCKCARECSAKVSEEDRKRIFTQYWDLNFAKQRRFIMDNVETMAVMSKRTMGTSRRSNTLVYRLDGKQVCKRYFSKTLAVSDSVVVQCMRRKRANNQTEWTDGRGKKLKQKFSKE